MISTPWGEVQGLRDLEQKTSSPSTDGASAALSSLPPRERLYAAMVAGCAERGFDNLTVTHLLTLGSVSRATFYETFENKEDCFVATMEAILTAVVPALTDRYRPDPDPEQRGREALRGFIELATSQYAAARLCIVEPFVVGAPALDALDEATERLRVLGEDAVSQIPGRERLPEDLSKAIIGGIFQVFFRRLQENASLDNLEEPLWKWALSYEAPPQPLRLRGRRPKAPPPDSVPPFSFCDPAERIVRGFAAAVAEKGYQATTISDIAAKASISQRTFYEYFENKQALLTAALDSSGEQMKAALLPTLRRSAGWPYSARAIAGASTRFFFAEPEFAYLRQVEVYAAGLDAIAQRDAVGRQIFAEAISIEDVPEVDRVTGEAIVGASYAIYFDWIRKNRSRDLPELAPLLAYINLAPLLGAERACEIANSDGR